MLNRRILLVVLRGAPFCAIALAGCLRGTSASFDEAFSIAPGTAFSALSGARFGGVSGLAFDTSAGELLGISDDRENSRVFRLRIQNSPLRVEPVGIIALHGSPVKLDAEGLVVLPGGDLLISSEGVQNEDPRQPPGILEFTHDGAFVRSLTVREKYLPPVSGPITYGVRANSSFESLTLTPDGRTLFTATETALVQDGEAADFDHGALVRVLEYRRQSETFVPGREWLYELDPVARPDFTASFFVTGVVELVALSDRDLLVLERSFAQEGGDHGRELNRIRLYRASLDGASDVSAIDSIANERNLRPAPKQLLIDLGAAPGLPPSLAALDNFEGLALFPALTDGRRPLFVVSDDNFSETQKTWFVRLMLR